MRNKKYIAILFVAIVSILSSCFKDDSVTDFKLINPIVIDVSGTPRDYAVLQGDTLRISPLVYRKGLDESKLFYEWRLTGNDYDLVIGKGMILDTVINVLPSTNEYAIVFTVTDSTTLIKEKYEFTLMVITPIGSGLIVADSKDGINSDLNLIMGKAFYFYVPEDTILRNLYSKNNGGNKIPGIVTGVSCVSTYKGSSITYITDKSIGRIDPLSYGALNGQSNKNLFMVAPSDEEFKPQILDKNYDKDVLICNGLMYERKVEDGNIKFSGSIFPIDYSDYKIAKYYNQGWGDYGKPAGFLFDDLKKRFIGFNSDYYNNSFLVFNNTSDENVFDINNVGNKTCLYMGPATNGIVYAVMKDNDNHSVYKLNMNSEGKGDDPLITKGINNLSSCSDIDNAKFFASNQREDVLYYATDNSVYATSSLEANDNPTSKLRYSTNPGEKITSMQVWTEWGGKVKYPNPEEGGEDLLSWAHYRTVVLTTYNETTGEGKVISIYIKTLNIGGLETNRKYHVEYGGFGRISAIGAQIL